ncbi:MAG: FAD-binding oxidoreductase [bacterium]
MIRTVWMTLLGLLGGRSSCGLCSVPILQGAGPLLPTELPWLTPEEQKDNIRLACQVKSTRDQNIQIPAKRFDVKHYRAQVVGLTDLTYDIKQVTLKLVEPAELTFRAGQFVQLEVPPYALTHTPLHRAYSIASAPAETCEIELEIRYVPDGIGTTYVHKHLKVGDIVTIRGPYGSFYLRPGAGEMIFIAGGSGMAPLKSILHEMARTKNPRACRYFFGARTPRDLFLVDRMRQFESDLPNFRFIPALSEPAPEDGWTGETGLITEVVDRQVRDASQAEAYLCGSPLMIDACVEVLRAKGMPDANIFYDKYV